MTDTTSNGAAGFGAGGLPASREWLARRGEAVLIPLGALVVGMAAFSIFILFLGK
jgi:general nucleoside transport system permease protein